MELNDLFAIQNTDEIQSVFNVFTDNMRGILQEDHLQLELNILQEDAYQLRSLISWLLVHSAVLRK